MASSWGGLGSGTSLLPRRLYTDPAMWDPPGQLSPTVSEKSAALDWIFFVPVSRGIEGLVILK